MLLEFDRIIGKDRIEIVLSIVRELELLVFRVMLSLSLYNFSPALYSLLLLVEEGVVFQEVQYHRGEEVVRTQQTGLLVQTQ